MSKTTNLNIRIEPELKEAAEWLFEEMGMSMSTAINIFLNQCVKEQTIPFKITGHKPNRKTLNALKEAEKMAKNPTEYPTYTFEEFKEILISEETIPFKGSKEATKFIFNIDKNKLNQIDELKKKLDDKRALNKITIKSLREGDILDWTYHSNAIEGNTLTLTETKVVLEGITIGGKSVDEHLEAINHKDAILFLEDLIKQEKDVLKLRNIKDIHRLVLKDIDNINAGIVRNKNVIISGATHIPPDYLKLDEELDKLMINYNDWKLLHPVIRAGLIHGEFVKIHPFIDGNGRTSRLLMNFEVMKEGYPPIIIKKEKRIDYYKALDKAHITKDYTDFINMLLDLEIEILNRYLKIIN